MDPTLIQAIVLVTTELKDSRDWHRNEELTIESVWPGPTGSSIGAVVVLASAAQYNHHALDAYQVVDYALTSLC